MKLRFSLLSFFVLLAGLTACGAQQTPSTIRVGVALYQQNDTFISTVAQNLQQFALEEEETHNIKINLSIVDGRSSQSVQNEQVDRFLDQDYDVLCVNMVDRTAAAGAVLKPVGRELCGAAVRGNIYVPGTDFVGLERYPAR